MKFMQQGWPLQDFNSKNVETIYVSLLESRFQLDKSSGTGHSIEMQVITLNVHNRVNIQILYAPKQMKNLKQNNVYLWIR